VNDELRDQLEGRCVDGVTAVVIKQITVYEEDHTSEQVTARVWCKPRYEFESVITRHPFEVGRMKWTLDNVYSFFVLLIGERQA